MKQETFKEKAIRWAYSSGLSFITGASIVLVAQIDNITMQSLQDGTVFGVLFVVVRAGFKAALEAFLANSVK